MQHFIDTKKTLPKPPPKKNNNKTPKTVSVNPLQQNKEKKLSLKIYH